MSTNAINDWLGPRVIGPVDPYAANPAADELEAGDPAAFAEALRNGPAPKLFEGGTRDVPTATASGIDPTFIGWLPVGVRHHAADLATEAEVHALFERVAGDPNARIHHPDLHAAEARLSAWAKHSTSPAPAPEPAAAQPLNRAGRRAEATLTVSPAELLAMGRRGEFLPPKSASRRPALVTLRQRTHTGRTV